MKIAFERVVLHNNDKMKEVNFNFLFCSHNSYIAWSKTWQKSDSSAGGVAEFSVQGRKMTVGPEREIMHTPLPVQFIYIFSLIYCPNINSQLARSAVEKNIKKDEEKFSLFINLKNITWEGCGRWRLREHVSRRVEIKIRKWWWRKKTF